MSNNEDRWGQFDDGVINPNVFNPPRTGAVVQTSPNLNRPFFTPNGGRVVNGGLIATGDFVRSELDGDSGYVKCFYRDSNMVTCDVEPGCCRSGCCPKDWLMMGGLYVLIVFVVVLVIVSIVAAIICAMRSKAKQRKEEKVQSSYAYSNYGGSQVGGYGGGAGSTYAPYGGGPPAPPSYASPYTYQVGPPSTRY